MNRPLQPLVLNYPTARQLEVFAVDDDGAIKVSWKSNNGNWNPPHPLSATSFAQPGTPLSGVYYPSGDFLEVFVVGNDGGIHGLWKAPHVRHEWQQPFRLANATNLAPP